MNYYLISHETEDKVVGAFKQIKELTIPTPKLVRDAYHDLDESRKEFHQKLPSLTVFKLAAKAKITDVLSSIFISMNVGFLASDKCAKLIRKSNLTNHRFHTVKIFGIPEELTYWFFYLIEDSSHILFDKSEFHRTDFSDNKYGEPIKIGSYKEFHDNNLKFLRAKPGRFLSFTEVSLNKPLDLIRLPGDSMIHISERLKSQFEENQITGLVYKPSKIPFKIA